MAEEQWVRKTRSEISKLRRAPPGVPVLAIPRANFAPTLDGRISTAEWAGALRIPLLFLRSSARAMSETH